MSCEKNCNKKIKKLAKDIDSSLSEFIKVISSKFDELLNHVNSLELRLARIESLYYKPTVTKSSNSNYGIIGFEKKE